MEGRDKYSTLGSTRSPVRFSLGASSASNGSGNGSGNASTLQSLFMDDATLLRTEYQRLIEEGNKSPKDIDKNLKKLRTLVLMKGLPPETEDEKKNIETKCSLRGRVWQILLRVPPYSAKDYIDLVQKGPSDVHDDFLKDGYRSFLNRKHETELLKRVTQAKICRMVNAFRHYSVKNGANVMYVQGLTNICAPFLYVMPEVDAFFTFYQFVTNYCPAYWCKGIVGAYAGLELFEKILKLVDPEVFKHFENTKFRASSLNLRCVLTFNSTTPPIGECLRLWDFLFAFGVHLNILLVVAQVVLMRDKILEVTNPGNLLNEKSWPQLDAEVLKGICIHIVRQLDDELYKKLVEHAIKVPEKRKFGTMPATVGRKMANQLKEI